MDIHGSERQDCRTGVCQLYTCFVLCWGPLISGRHVMTPRNVSASPGSERISPQYCQSFPELRPKWLGPAHRCHPSTSVDTRRLRCSIIKIIKWCVGNSAPKPNSKTPCRCNKNITSNTSARSSPWHCPLESSSSSTPSRPSPSSSARFCQQDAEKNVVLQVRLAQKIHVIRESKKYWVTLGSCANCILSYPFNPYLAFPRPIPGMRATSVTAHMVTYLNVVVFHPSVRPSIHPSIHLCGLARKETLQNPDAEWSKGQPPNKKASLGRSNRHCWACRPELAGCMAMCGARKSCRSSMAWDWITRFSYKFRAQLRLQKPCAPRASALIWVPYQPQGSSPKRLTKESNPPKCMNLSAKPPDSKELENVFKI